MNRGTSPKLSEPYSEIHPSSSLALPLSLLPRFPTRPRGAAITTIATITTATFIAAIASLVFSLVGILIWHTDSLEHIS